MFTLDLRNVLRTVAVAIMLATFLAVAPASAGSVVDAVHLRMTVSTTSDWAKVHLPGDVVGGRLVGTTGPVAQLLPAGLNIGGAAGTITIDVVVYQPAQTDTVAVRIEKGYIGAVDLTLTDRSSGRNVLAMTNEVHSSSDPNNTTIQQIRHRDFFRHAAALPDAGVDRKVLAFYYPWFHTYDDNRMTDQPSEPRSVYTRSQVASMVGQAAANGVDGFVVSYAGEAADGYAFDLVRDAAATQDDFTVSAYIETAMALGKDRPAVDILTEWMTALADRGKSPTFLTLNGTPVVFAYEMGKVSPSTWATVRARLASTGRAVAIIGDANHNSFNTQTVGAHQYTAGGTEVERAAFARRQSVVNRAASLLYPENGARLVVGTVSPGYDDRLVRDGFMIPREDGERYVATWRAAMAGTPDWVVVTSWNEWFEGTSIEPSAAFGDLALTQTRQLSEDWAVDGVLDGASPTTTTTSGHLSGKGKPTRAR